MTTRQRCRRDFWVQLARDREFWLALLAGPAFWVWRAGEMPELAITWPRLLWLVLVVPIVEELAFRGGLQGMLADRFPRRWCGQRLSLANLLTSLLFAAAHAGVAAHWSGVLVFVPSLAFGYFRDKYQRVMPAALLHGFYNAGFFLL
ncbi:MAG: JDVT-CTERM system glutamic-type intramembrane protease MrtJ [Candidatus Competibacteraceae bacterium]